MNHGSAHGKAILFGEYAVLEGVTGYAIALKDFKLSLSIDPSHSILQFPDILKYTHISSNIPLESGLGSSAALSVALARALFPSEQVLSKAKEFEDFFHNKSSGIDTFTSASGGLCSLTASTNFKRLPEHQTKKLSLCSFSIIDTHHRRLVKHVKESINNSAYPQFIQEATQISNTFTKLLEAPENIHITDIAGLFNRAQRALCNLGVSTPQIDSICSSLNSQFPNNLGIKITGAGGGGCLLLVHTTEISKEMILEALKALLSEPITLHYNIGILT